MFTTGGIMVIAKVSEKVTTAGAFVPAEIFSGCPGKSKTAKSSADSFVGDISLQLKGVVAGMGPQAKKIVEMHKFLGNKDVSNTEKLKFVVATLTNGNLDLQLAVLRLIDVNMPAATLDNKWRAVFDAVKNRKISTGQGYLKKVKIRTAAEKLLVWYDSFKSCSKTISRLNAIDDHVLISDCSVVATKQPTYLTCIQGAKTYAMYYLCTDKLEDYRYSDNQETKNTKFHKTVKRMWAKYDAIKICYNKLSEFYSKEYYGAMESTAHTKTIMHYKDRKFLNCVKRAKSLEDLDDC